MKAYGLPLILTVLAALFVALFGFLLLKGRRGKRPPARHPSDEAFRPEFVEWEKRNVASLAAVDAKVKRIMAKLGLS